MTLIKHVTPAADLLDGTATLTDPSEVEAIEALLPPAAQEQAVAVKRRRCIECGRDWSDPPSRLCPGCQAYAGHLA